MIGIAERDLKKAMATRSTLVMNISSFESQLEGLLEANQRQDLELEGAKSRTDAELFWHQRSARGQSAQELRLRISEAYDLLKDLDFHLSEIKTRIYKLEKSREVAYTKFQLEQRRQEDKDFDDLATLRYKP